MAVWQLVPNASHGVGGLLHRGGHTSTGVGDQIFVIAGRKGSKFYKDLLVYDTIKQSWKVLQQTTPLPARANHMAVCVGQQIWVIGGADENTVFGDVWVLDVKTLTWSQPKLSGAVELLTRCSAGCDVHPTQPHVVLLFGGYGQPEPGNVYVSHHNDLVRVNTSTGYVSSLSPSGPLPQPRCFHTMTSVDGRCWVVGGRIIEQGPLHGANMVSVYDPTCNSWIPCEVLGDEPDTRQAKESHQDHHLGGPRSSHKAVAVGSRLLVTGGNLARPGSSLAVWLRVEAVRGGVHGDRLLVRWSDDTLPTHSRDKTTLSARAAHGANLVGSCVYLSLGYTEGKGKSYLSDMLKLQLDPTLFATHAWPSNKQLVSTAAVATSTTTTTTNVWELSPGHGQGPVQGQPGMLSKVDTTNKAVTVTLSPSAPAATKPQQQGTAVGMESAQVDGSGRIKVPGTSVGVLGGCGEGGRSPSRSRSGGSLYPKVMDMAQRQAAEVDRQAGMGDKHAAVGRPGVGSAAGAAGGGRAVAGGKGGAGGRGSKVVGASGKRAGVFEGDVVDLTDVDEVRGEAGQGVDKEGGPGAMVNWLRKKQRTSGAVHGSVLAQGGGRVQDMNVPPATGNGRDVVPGVGLRKPGKAEGAGGVAHHQQQQQQQQQQEASQPVTAAAAADADMRDGVVHMPSDLKSLTRISTVLTPPEHTLAIPQTSALPCPIHDGVRPASPPALTLLQQQQQQQPHCATGSGTVCVCPPSPTRHPTFVDQTQVGETQVMNTQVQLLQQQVHSLQQQLNMHQQQLADQQRVLHQSQQHEGFITSLNDQIKQTRMALDDAHKSVAQLRAAQATLESELGHTKAALTEAQKQATSSTLQCNSLRGEKQQWLAERDTQQHQHNTLQEQYNKLQQQQNKLQQQYNAAQAKCSDYESRLKASEASFESLQATSTRTAAQYEQRLASKDAAVTLQAAQIGELQASLTSIQVEHHRSVESNRTLQQHLTECRDRLAEAERRAATELEASGVREVDLRTRLEGKTVELRTAQDQLKAQATEMALIKAQNERLSAELAQSRQLASTSESMCQQLRTRMASMQAHMVKAAQKLAEDLKQASDSLLDVVHAQQPGTSPSG